MTHETDINYWDCECQENYIHSKSKELCPICGVNREDQPDSLVKEVELKIGRHTYTITEQDIFIDNQQCIQLKTQSKEKKAQKWDFYPPLPRLSQTAIKKINRFNRVTVKQHDDIQYCKLGTEKEAIRRRKNENLLH